jgi:hypothetical protein
MVQHILNILILKINKNHLKESVYLLTDSYIWALLQLSAVMALDFLTVKQLMGDPLITITSLGL